MSIDVSKLVFSSNFRYEYIAKKGSVLFTVTTTFPNAVVTYTIPHNLGYIPFFRAWYTFNNISFFELFSGSTSYNIGGNGIEIDTVYADTTNLYVTVDNQGAATVSGRIYYRIYAEPQI